jgi:hypothetical protein
MSTVWKGEVYPPVGQSDVEQMAQIQHFNTPEHDSSETLKTSAIDIDILNRPSKEEDEGVAAHISAGNEVAKTPVLDGFEPPPDGGLIAWLQGKLPNEYHFTQGY